MPILREHVKTIFGKAAEIASAADRSRFLDEACGGDAGLRAEVEDLLASLGQAGDFLAPCRVSEETTGSRLDERPGTAIGPYKLLQQIGVGGMGVVYMAEQTEPVQRRVALKIIKPGMDSQQVIARFEAERQALALMDHPHIAKVLDAGTTAAGRPYFVMELVKGVPITKYCDDKHLTLRQRLELMIPVCQAIQHAHQKGIIHRDIKPTNVLIAQYDGQPVPKVIDFGVAKATAQKLTERTMFTELGQVVGTIEYMSPEQAELNQLDIDTRSDIYSLGVLLYELLTGSTPFDKQQLRSMAFHEMLRIIREEEPQRPSTKLSSSATLPSIAASRETEPARLTKIVRGELDWIVMKALEKDRSRRYETAGALTRDIERFLSDEPVQACPPTATYRLRKFATKHKTALTSAAVLVASLVVGTSVSVWQAIRATTAEAQAQSHAMRAVANEARAIAEEQRAERMAQAEATQRMHAENNFKAALDAVDRMLGNVNDSAITELPGTGPMRRRILRDATDLYNQLPLESQLDAPIRFRISQIWFRLVPLASSVGEPNHARYALNNSVDSLEQLLSDHPGNKSYTNALAEVCQEAHWVYGNAHEMGERLVRRSCDLFCKLAETYPGEESWRVKHAHALGDLGEHLAERGKREEGLDCTRRALQMMTQTPAANGFDRAEIREQLAQFFYEQDVPEADRLLRHVLVDFRGYILSGERSSQHRNYYGQMLRRVGDHFAKRCPEESEKLFKDAIEVWRKLVNEAPASRGANKNLTQCLTHQARLLRRIAKQEQVLAPSHLIEKWLTTANGHFQEALVLQRGLAAQRIADEDRTALLDLLHEQSQYLLSPPHPLLRNRSEADLSAIKLQAASLLFEAIQLSRALVAEFPSNAGYKERLAVLMKLRELHFTQSTEAARLPTESTSPIGPDGA